jgi:hypothetical protein
MPRASASRSTDFLLESLDLVIRDARHVRASCYQGCLFENLSTQTSVPF